MVDICLRLLNMSHKHLEDRDEDVSSRCDPVYVGRVVSAMVGVAAEAGCCWASHWVSTGMSFSSRSTVRTTAASWKAAGGDPT